MVHFQVTNKKKNVPILSESIGISWLLVDQKSETNLI